MTATRRADLVAEQRARPPWGSRAFGEDDPPVRIGASGSGESLLLLGWTARELAAEVAAGARLLAQFGITAGTRVANTLPGALATPGSLLLGDVVEAIGGLDVPLGQVESEAAAKAAWELFDRVQANVLVAEPGAAATFFAAAPHAERAWWRGIVWLVRGVAVAPVPAPPGFAGWQRTWVAVPEATSFAAGSCAAGRFHLVDGVVAEVVDGELLIGPRRYASALRARSVGPCACGAGPSLAL